MRTLLLSSFVLLACVTAPASQDPSLLTPQLKGTAAIRGQVVVAGGGGPVARLRVIATPMQRSERRGPPPRYHAITSESGQFEIRDLPAGRYSVMAMVAMDRPQLVSTWFGDEAEASRVVVELAEGKVVEKVVLTVQRSGVIIGRVVNEFGEPVAWARVVALLRRAESATPDQQSQGRETDDLGRFRIFGLRPGEYYVRVEPGMHMAGPGDGDQLQHLTAYYPGVSSVEESQPIHVAAGQEVGEIEIQLRKGQTYRVSGVVLNSKGAPAARADVMHFREGSGSGSSVQPDGSFVLPGLLPGDYSFQASTMFGLEQDDEPEQSPPVKLRVDSDIDGLTLMMRRAAKIAGHLVIDGDPPIGSAGIRVMGSRPEHANGFGPPAMTSARDDGTFTLTRLFGPTVIRLPELRPPWHLQSVRFKSADITDVPTEFADSADPRHLDVVASNRGGRIIGRVVDTNGAVAAKGGVVVFAADQKKWFPNATTSRFAGIGSDGKFELTGLRPDTYLLVATTSLEVAMSDGKPAYEKLAPLATTLVLAQNESRDVSLTLTTLPR